MGRLTGIRNQYQRYIAAREAVEKIKPEIVEVVYKKGGRRDDDGILTYNPGENKITIRSRCYRISKYIKTCECVSIDANDVPALIKALRKFIE